MTDECQPKIVLETSAAIAYLNGEPEWELIDHVVELAEQRKIKVFMSDFAWAEIRPHSSHDTHRLKRLKEIAHHIPKVARVGEWILGMDAIGHDSSHEIERNLAPSVGWSQADVEQFLSYCAQIDVDFFVTKDKGFLKAKPTRKLHDKFAFRVGEPADCVAWLRAQSLA